MVAGVKWALAEDMSRFLDFGKMIQLFIFVHWRSQVHIALVQDLGGFLVSSDLGHRISLY